METLRDEVTEETRKVLKREGKATTDLIRKVLRDGMDTRKTSSVEEINKYNDYVIMDVSWGQYAAGGNNKTRTIFQGTNSCSGFEDALKNNEEIIAIIHHAHHWSFTAIDTRKRALQMYDPANTIHVEANIKVKKSVEKVLNVKQKQRWTSEQMEVPSQTEGESCGYRMLYNLNRVCGQQEIQAIDREETALEGYMIEIIKMMLNVHQGKQKEEEK